MEKFNNIKEALIYGNKILAEAVIVSSKLDTRLLLQHALNFDHEQIILNQEYQLSPQQYKDYLSLLERRAKREPLSHIIGKREFYSLEFFVTKDTLDPRPDSETLIEAVLELFPERHKPLKILDLGTGTGCLVLTLLHLYPNAHAVAIDISAKALQVASKNAHNLKLAERIDFVLSDWGNSINGNFDLIISNPPYIKDNDINNLEQEVALYEPHDALFGGPDGLNCYRNIAKGIKHLLISNSILIVECGANQHDEIIKIFFDYGLLFNSSYKDLANITRCIAFTISSNL